MVGTLGASSALGPADEPTMGLAEIDALYDKLNDYTDWLSGDALGIARDDWFADLMSIIRTIGTAPVLVITRIFDLVLSGLGAMPAAWHAATEAAHGLAYSQVAQGDLEILKLALERWLDLAHNLIVAAEHRSIHFASVAAASASALGTSRRGRGRGRGGSTAGPSKRARTAASRALDEGANWDWHGLKVRAMHTLARVLNLPLHTALTDAERDVALGHVSKSVSELLQNKDRTSLRNPELKRLLFAIYADCIVKHGLNVLVACEQNLKFFDFLAEPMADFLVYLEQEREHTKLTADLLQAIGAADVTDAAHAKSLALFLTALANAVPKSVQRCLVYLQAQLDCPEYPLRCAVLHCVAAVVRHLMTLEETVDHGAGPGFSVQSLVEVIEERFRDVSAQGRKKALLVVADLLEYKYFYVRYPALWLHLLGLCVGRLQDKNQPVRASAIRVVTLFLVRHPFTVHGNSLRPATVAELANDVRDELQAFLEAAEADPDAPVDNKVLTVLKTRHDYFTNLRRFLALIHDVAIPSLTQLLASKNKSEVMDAMEFFVEAHGLDLPGAATGLSTMWQLVFNVRNTDHVKDIHAHLVQCFHTVYLAREPETTVRNLITLTYHTTLAEVTCLERVVGMCLEQGFISDHVVAHLWAMLGASPARVTLPIKQRRGATLVLSWLCRAKPALVGADQLALLVRVLRTHRDATLARYCCQLLQCVESRLPRDAELFAVLQAWLTLPAPAVDVAAATTASGDPWYAMAQQALKTVYAISQQPMVVANDVLRARAAVLADPAGRARVPELARLFFVLGHTAVQQLVLLEQIEADYKRQQAASEANGNKAAGAAATMPAGAGGNAAATNRSRRSATSAAARTRSRRSRTSRRSSGGNLTDGDGADDDNELDQVVGTVEDVFAENLAAVRELELLSGNQSLLAAFGPLVVEVAQSPATPPALRVFATTCLAQFMCVSGGFCEDHLPLLKSILAAADAHTRSNLMVALGDLVVCWNTVINDDIRLLYDALRDAETDADGKPAPVKKNALMVLLHLILNGMVKVKGQLSALALCLEDPDERISGLTKLFLAELAGKDQALYNNLSDVLSHLLAIGVPASSTTTGGDSAAAKKKVKASDVEDSDADDAMDVDSDPAPEPEATQPLTATQTATLAASDVDEAAVLRVLKFLFGFITKDKQTENLLDKLCQRLREAEHPRQWRAIAYAISLLPWETATDAKCRKLLEHFPAFADKLHEDAVHKSVTEILHRASKAASAPANAATNAANSAAAAAGGAPANQRAAQPLIEELTARVEQARAGLVEEAARAAYGAQNKRRRRAAAAVEAAVAGRSTGRGRGRGRGGAAAAGTPAARRRRAAAVVETESSESSSSGSGSGSGSDDEEEETRAKPVKRSKPSQRPTAKAASASGSGSDEEEAPAKKRAPRTRTPRAAPRRAAAAAAARKVVAQDESSSESSESESESSGEEESGEEGSGSGDDDKKKAPTTKKKATKAESSASEDEEAPAAKKTAAKPTSSASEENEEDEEEAPAAKKRKAAKSAPSASEEDEDEEDAPSPAKPSPKPKGRKLVRRAARPASSSDEEEAEDELEPVLSTPPRKSKPSAPRKTRESSDEEESDDEDAPTVRTPARKGGRAAAARIVESESEEEEAEEESN
ncbi:condensin complex non-SMC subunit Cnd1 [Blastocladiella emersonii ATCC 22665]|nr:condensin complex non-SMC subunit Cnd1 [Blastocladiella emersonii ATCC 22665]